MRGNIIDSWYEYTENDIPITTCVLKETKYGTFCGTVNLTPDDEDIANVWDGYRFAEMKCDIQAYKEKANRMLQRAIGIEHAYTVILKSYDNLSGYDFLDVQPFLNKLEKQVDVAFKEANKAKEQYELMRDSYSGFCDHVIKQRREIRTRY